MNDVRFLEMFPVNVRLEYQWMRVALLDAVVQLAIQCEVKLLTAVGALGFNLN